MRTSWDEREGGAPLSLIVSAFAPVAFDGAADHVDAFRRNTGEQLAGRAKDLALGALFNEELGALLQIRTVDRTRVMQALREAGLGACSHVIGQLNARDEIRVM